MPHSSASPTDGSSRRFARLLDPYPEEETVPTCEVCGNDYDKTMEITLGGKSHIFDSFECAIHELAPRCPHCDCTVIGHGVEADGSIYCCAFCARESGATELRDRV